jgi:hypothetical protein
MARYVVLPSLSDLMAEDDAACAFNEEAQHDLLLRPPPTPEERMAYAALFPPPVAEALGKRRRQRDMLLTVDELNDIAPVFDEDELVIVDEEEEDEDAPERLPRAGAPGSPKRQRLPPRRPNVLRADVQRAVEEADAAWLRAHALNVRQQPYEVYARSKFKAGGMHGLSTLRLAIYHACTEKAPAQAPLETLETLVTHCGLDPHEEEASETLVEFVSTRQASGERHAGVLRALLKGAKFLRERAPVREALARLVEGGREECVVELVRSRGEALEDEDVFDLVTRVMLFGTHGMLRRTLRALDADGRVPPTLCHPKTRSTLLHFAAKRCDVLMAAVAPYSDATRTDRRGRRAADHAARRAARVKTD